MAFIGNTNTTQAFTPAIDFFSGTGSATAFTLSRPVASVAQVQVTIDNVVQNPSSAYTISGSTITFTSAPLSGTNNIYVYYTSPITQIAALPQNPQVFGNLQFSSLGARITGDFSNATIDNRAIFQSTTANGASGVIAIPNGTGVVASWSAQNNSDANNGANIALRASNTDMSVRSGILGTGTYLPMTFYTGGSERVRVDTSGNVGINTVSPTQRLSVAGSLNVTSGSQIIAGATAIFADGTIGTPSLQWNAFAGAAGGAVSIADTATNIQSISFRNTNGYVGNIATSGSNTTYTTASDYRLKENIAPMAGALAVVQQLKPCTYNWKVDGSNGQGFIAHELQAVVPDCVSGEKDEVNADGSPKHQSIDTSFLVATLTAAIQEQQALITSLTARITALESR